jgi:hypothetical protein
MVSIGKVGYIAGLTAFAFCVSFVVVQMLQLVGLLVFPLDEILIYGTSLCIAFPFIIEMLAFHHVTPNNRKFWTHAALMFTVIYAVFVTANYSVQLATVIPLKISGSGESVRVLEQSPHSIFWDYDAVGYISMGIAALLSIPALNNSGLERWVRISFTAHALVTPLITIVYFYPHFSDKLLLLGLPWGITAPIFMLLLAILLKRNSRVSS